MLRHAVALARSTHPVPSLAVTAVAVLLGVAIGLEPWRVVLLGIAIALDQASVGLSNDALDAHRDREAGRTDKPVARGDVASSTVHIAAVSTAVLSLLLTLPLGTLALAAHAVALGSAWLYNVVAKSTVLSALPYIVSFGMLPAIATLASAPPLWPQWWAMAAGALLGVAAHIANVLPDLDDDRRTGVSGLPHRLGARRSLVIAWAALVLAALAVSYGSGFTAVAIAGLAVSIVLAVAAVAIAWRRGAG
ncbi:UbiA family prenyltransferase, partial [Mesorhizobium japonicum]|uniref:UbiA family prenyltransferase n=1 Tax=Mesorhizobium japonicum TaxID=2066070 RepID=UPI003B591970